MAAVATKVSFRELAKLHAKQNDFLDALISRPQAAVLYGGSGYSGKTVALIAAAVWLNGKYRALGFKSPRGFIGCMSYTQITDRIIPGILEMFGDWGVVTENRQNGWHFRFHDPSMGVICFRNLDDPAKRKGSGFWYVLIDELTECFREMLGDIFYFRLQRTHQKLPFMPFGAATNPDGPGHSWVKKLWVERDFSGDDEDFDKEDFIFVPALPTDNPAFDETKFTTATAGLSASVRKARRTGSWDTPEGARFPQLSATGHLFDFKEKWPYGLPESYNKIIGVDWGTKNPYAALWIAIDYDGDLWVYREDYKTGFSAELQALRIKEISPPNEAYRGVYLDPAMWNKLANVKDTDPCPADDYKAILEAGRFGGVLQGYNRHISTFATLEKLFNRGNGYPDIFIEKSCVNLWRELTGATFDKRPGIVGSKEEMDPRQPDHAIAALRYAVHTYLEVPSQPGESGLPSVEQIRAAQLQESYDNDRKRILGRSVSRARV